MTGVFIAIEGIDGSGKSSVARKLATALRVAGNVVVLTREPGGTEAGTHIRALLLDTNRSVCPKTELLLMCADRAEHVTKVIVPALKAGSIVICDRFADSTRAYQGYGLGLNQNLVDDAIEIATGGLTPDLVLLLDLDPLSANARREGDFANLNALDGRDLAYRSRVRQGYLEIAGESASWHVIDASMSLDDVFARVLELAETAIASKHAPR